MKTRPVEMLICWGCGQWNAESFVQIPADTPEDRIEEVSIAKMTEALETDEAEGRLNDFVAFIGVYNIPEEWEDDDDP